MPLYMIQHAIRSKGGPVYTTDRLRVSYGWNLREKARRHVDGIGTIREMEHTTRNAKRFSVLAGAVDDGSSWKLYREDGLPGAPSYVRHFEVKAGETRETLRVMLPADERELAAADAEIAEAMSVVNAMREKRKRFVRTAFKRAAPMGASQLHEMVPADQK